MYTNDISADLLLTIQNVKGDLHNTLFFIQEIDSETQKN